MGDIRLALSLLLWLASFRNSQTLRPCSSGTQRYTATPRCRTSRSTSGCHYQVPSHPFASLSQPVARVPLQRQQCLLNRRGDLRLSIIGRFLRRRVPASLVKACAQIRGNGMATEGSEESDGGETSRPHYSVSTAQLLISISAAPCTASAASLPT